MPAARRLALLLPLVVMAGCKGKEPAPPAAPAADAAASGPSIESTTYAASLSVAIPTSTKTASGLYYRDLAPGTGPQITAGQRVSVHYTGWLPNGTQFDANGPNDPPYQITVGGHEVIAGWDEGLVGMRVGGKRQLIVPPALGYGAAGNGPIPPNAIMVFNIEVVSVK